MCNVLSLYFRAVIWRISMEEEEEKIIFKNRQSQHLNNVHEIILLEKCK